MPNLMERANDWLMYNSSVPLSQKIFFTENLRVMVKAGLSISESLNTLSLQAESKAFSRIISLIREDVETGKSLSSGLQRFPKIFPPIFTNMVGIGEVSGTLDQVMDELTQQMKKDHKLRSKVKGAMAYPIVILVAMLGITIGLITLVLPKLLEIFKEFNDVKLPLATRMLIFVSDFVQAHGILVLIGAIVAVVAFIAWSRTNTGRKVIHRALIIAPIIGPIVRKVNLARFSRTLSGLLKTDIPVVQSLQVTADVLGNFHYHQSLLETAELIKRGDTISESLEKHPRLYPPLVVQMVAVGERSGNVDSMLEDIAEFYEQQVDNVLDSLSSIIEPILILLLGGMVGGIALAVMMPMYSLTQSISES
ncbi:type II secretion system F family protein [Candidatus Uhrbacteria bacterium]|nr:type II secretion system F family protein [Candidatus Uhrbacteria bacterium]